MVYIGQRWSERKGALPVNGFPLTLLVWWSFSPLYYTDASRGTVPVSFTLLPDFQSSARFRYVTLQVANSAVIWISQISRLFATAASSLSFIMQNGFGPLLSHRKDLRIAIIGQSVFGQEVYKLLKRQGRKVVGVFTIPDDKNNGRPDPLAVQADQDGVPVFKFPRWRLKGTLIFETRN